MANLSSIERRKLERLLRMGSGYVLDFSDRTFSEFFEEHTRRDIDATIYRERGTSKVNRNFFRNKCNGIRLKVHSEVESVAPSTSRNYVDLCKPGLATPRNLITSYVQYMVGQQNAKAAIQRLRPVGCRIGSSEADSRHLQQCAKTGSLLAHHKADAHSII